MLASKMGGQHRLQARSARSGCLATSGRANADEDVWERLLDRSKRLRKGDSLRMCNKEKFWPALCQKLGRPEWSEDERFRRFADRLRHRALITEMLDRKLGQRTTAQ
jgi:hypothetical protein